MSASLLGAVQPADVLEHVEFVVLVEEVAPHLPVRALFRIVEMYGLEAPVARAQATKRETVQERFAVGDGEIPPVVFRGEHDLFNGTPLESVCATPIWGRGY